MSEPGNPIISSLPRANRARLLALRERLQTNLYVVMAQRITLAA